MGFYLTRIPRLADTLLPDIVFRLHEPDASRKTALRKIALTFDDAPSPATPRLLQLLSDLKVKATFFLIGKQIDLYPSLVKEIAGAGHVLGNHSYSHSRRYLPDDLERELHQTQTQLDSLAEATKLFRFPYGSFTWRTLRRVRALGFAPVLWSLMPGDFDAAVPVSDLRQRLNRATGGDIIVLHDALKCIQKLEAVLPDFIAERRENHFEFEILGDAALPKRKTELVSVNAI